uniref:ACB domain-containing protein n=1 Tax=Strongyloides venezuelensis TaxID=75913 RepID=A0A0K0FEC3_STRVS
MSLSIFPKQMFIEKNDEEKYSLEEMFLAAVKIIQNLPKEGPISTSNDTKLSYYSLFKQSTIGPCDQEQPSFWNVVEKYKWDAWNKLGSMDKETSMKKYLELFNKQIDDTIEAYGMEYFLKLEKDHNLEDVLEPAFKILGRSMHNPLTCDSQNSILPIEKDKIQIIEEEVKSNDGDYIDATEDMEFESLTKLQPPLSENKSFSEDTIKIFTKTFSRFINLLEKKTLELSNDVVKLTNTVIEQNNIMKKMLIDKEKDKNISKRMANSTLWKIIFFLSIWPFFVHYILKYWKMIKMLFSMYLEW